MILFSGASRLGVEIFSGEPTNLVSWIKSAIGKTLISIVGQCSAVFEGRVSSSLEVEERVLLLKKNKAVILHGVSGLKPLNWQGSGSRIAIRQTPEGFLLVEAVNSKKSTERILITFHNISLVFRVQGSSGELSLFGSEQDIVNYLLENPDLIEEGFQPVLKERPTEFGYIDIIGIDKLGRKTIVEVKRRTATPVDVQQLLRYVQNFQPLDSKGSGNIRAILIAPGIGKKAFAYLKANGLEFKQVNIQQIIREKQALESLDPSLDRWLE